MKKQTLIATIIRITTILMGATIIFLVIFVPLNSFYHFNYLKLPDFSYQPMEQVEIQIKVSPADGMEMVYVPEGAFWMGSGANDDRALSSERPLHEVYLGAYWIDRTEVSNAQYALCVEAGTCAPPTAFGVEKINSNTREWYYNNPEYDDYPVVYVDWYAAKTYCEWAGRRLPTEAEWEKAARGTDQRRFPWGNKNITGKLVNLADRHTNHEYSYRLVDDGYLDTAPVGNYPKGASPYGAYDMAGNVWEWTADWYSSTYYAQSSLENPTGPESGTQKIMRGGSYNNSHWGIRPTTRVYLGPIYAYGYVGFRCVLPAD